MSNVLQDKAARPSGLVSLERLMVSNCWTNDNNERRAMHLTDIISLTTNDNNEWSDVPLVNCFTSLYNS